MNESTVMGGGELNACEVPDCPAVPDVDGRRCALHRSAATAEQAHCVKRKCVACRRLFQKADFVKREPERAGDVFGFVHIACESTEKKPTKREARESVKPLFGDLP